MREVSAIKGSIVIAQPSRMTRLAILSSQEPGSDALKPAASPEILREVVRRCYQRAIPCTHSSRSWAPRC